MRARSIATVAVALTIGAAIAFWYVSAASQAPIPEVKQVVADSGGIVSSIRSAGIVQSERTVQVMSEAHGVVIEATPKVGDLVKRGQVLVKVSNQEALAEVRGRALAAEELVASIRPLERQLEALRQDYAAGGATLASVKDAQNKLEAERAAHSRAMADLDAARLRLRQYVLTSPINGTVIERKIDQGEYVQTGTPLYTLATTEELEILVKVDPSEAPSIKPGMPVNVSVEGSGNPPVQEHVLRIEPTVKKDGSADYLPVWVSASSKALDLVPNQQVDAGFATEKRNAAVRLPLEALVTRNGHDHVWLVRDGRLALTRVTVGLLGDRYVEIQKGLQAGQRVAMLEGKNLQEGDAVRPVAMEASR